jgi:glycosyltransferase involved in cell wall biosynthesis
MKIGIDISSWLNPRGQGRYTRELVHALLKLDRSNDYWLFVDAETARRCQDLPESDRSTRVIVNTSQAGVCAATTSGHRTAPDLWSMIRAARGYRNCIDIFYFPSATTFFPLWRTAKIVLTIHDAIPNKYPDLIFAHRRSLLLWKLKLAYAVRRATVIATVSETAKQDIAHEFGLQKDRIRVIPGAVSPLFRHFNNCSESRQVLAAEYAISNDERFLLYVGGFGSHKNLPMLIDAFARLKERAAYNDLKLVLAGDWSAFQLNHRALEAQVTRLGLVGKVIFPGFVPENHLVHFYNLAAAFVTASLDEGFGLPPLEAMACGTPVVASRIGAIKEVLGPAGRYFAPSDNKEITQALDEVLCDSELRREMARQGLLRSQVFSWGQSSIMALRLFEELCPQG